MKLQPVRFGYTLIELLVVIVDPLDTRGPLASRRHEGAGGGAANGLSEPSAPDWPGRPQSSTIGTASSFSTTPSMPTVERVGQAESLPRSTGKTRSCPTSTRRSRTMLIAKGGTQIADEKIFRCRSDTIKSSSPTSIRTGAHRRNRQPHQLPDESQLSHKTNRYGRWTFPAFSMTSAPRISWRSTSGTGRSSTPT